MAIAISLAKMPMLDTMPIVEVFFCEETRSFVQHESKAQIQYRVRNLRGYWPPVGMS